MIDNGIDGARAETIRAGLLGIAEEMRTTLVRTAFSPVIYEVLDFGISIYDARCRLIAEAPGLTRFLGANDYAVPILAERIGPKNLAEGDVVVSNYPYWNAAHSYDATMMAPVFADGQEGPAGYLCVRAHWIDLGAKDPGYVIDSTDMHQEGLILPGLKLVKGGVPDAELFELIAFNSRLPETLLGDIRAQLAALATGRNRFRALVLRHGMAAIDAAVERTIAHGRAVARSALARLPEGRWEAEDWLDGDGLTETPVRMHVVVSHADGKMEMDFSGSAPATRGPVNLPFGSTLATAKVAFKALTSPFAATNAGHMEPLEVRATPGTLFHAVYPAPTFTQWTGIVALELIFKALARGMPDRLPASSGGDVPGFMMIGNHPETGRPFALSSNEGVGWGGTPRHDGRWAGSHPSQSIVRNTPVEVLESRTGMRIERLELRAGGYGAGARRGGPGLRRDIRFTSPGEFLTIAKKTKSPPWSVAGGAEAAPTRLTLNPGTASERRLGTSRTAVAPGDTVRIETAGGAGHGPEEERPTALRVADLADGFAAPGKTRGDAA
jgi:N-methylhydantoinase B